MKEITLLVLFLGFFSFSASGQLTFSESELQGIKENFKKQEACWNKGDHACYVEAYYPSEEVQTVSRGGVTKGYENILASYRKYFPREKMGKLRFDQFSYKKLSKRYAYVVGRFNLTYEGQDEVRRGWFSVLMEKIDGQWYLISDHSS